VHGMPQAPAVQGGTGELGLIHGDAHARKLASGFHEVVCPRLDHKREKCP